MEWSAECLARARHSICEELKIQAGGNDWRQCALYEALVSIILSEVAYKDTLQECRDVCQQMCERFAVGGISHLLPSRRAVAPDAAVSSASQSSTADAESAVDVKQRDGDSNIVLETRTTNERDERERTQGSNGGTGVTGGVEVNATERYNTPPASPHRYALCRTPTALHCSWAGTTSLQDLVQDSRFSLATIRDSANGEVGGVHRGFFAVARSMPYDVLWRRAQEEDLNLIFGGHSLGGAVGMLCTLLLLLGAREKREEDVIMQRVRSYSFGQPLVGNSQLREYVHGRGWDAVLRVVVTEKDQVPRLLLFPPRGFLRLFNAVIERRKRGSEDSIKDAAEVPVEVRDAPGAVPVQGESAQDVSRASGWFSRWRWSRAVESDGSKEAEDPMVDEELSSPVDLTYCPVGNVLLLQHDATRALVDEELRAHFTARVAFRSFVQNHSIHAYLAFLEQIRKRIDPEMKCICPQRSRIWFQRLRAHAPLPQVTIAPELFPRAVVCESESIASVVANDTLACVLKGEYLNTVTRAIVSISGKERTAIIDRGDRRSQTSEGSKDSWFIWRNARPDDAAFRELRLAVSLPASELESDTAHVVLGSDFHTMEAKVALHVVQVRLLGAEGAGKTALFGALTGCDISDSIDSAPDPARRDAQHGALRVVDPPGVYALQYAAEAARLCALLRSDRGPDILILVHNLAHKVGWDREKNRPLFLDVVMCALEVGVPVLLVLTNKYAVSAHKRLRLTNEISELYPVGQSRTFVVNSQPFYIEKNAAKQPEGIGELRQALLRLMSPAARGARNRRWNWWIYAGLTAVSSVAYIASKL